MWLRSFALAALSISCSIRADDTARVLASALRGWRRGERGQASAFGPLPQGDDWRATRLGLTRRRWQPWAMNASVQSSRQIIRCSSWKRSPILSARGSVP
jgi:hypothetical protein